MPQKWAIRLVVEGDLRFLSHHDMLRAMERLVARALLPVRYSQGFNPRPVLSLACPRPVGVASLDDLLVISLDAPLGGQEILRRLNEHALGGMRFLEARTVPPSASGRPVRMELRMPLKPEQVDLVRSNLSKLAGEDSWQIQRLTSPKGRGAAAPRPIDLRPLVAAVELRGEDLHLCLVRRGDMWARPGEVLRLLGLDERVDLARMVRTAVEYEL